MYIIYIQKRYKMIKKKQNRQIHVSTQFIALSKIKGCTNKKINSTPNLSKKTRW